MKCVEMIETETETEPVLVDNRQLVRLPMGLLGFEQIKEYILLCNPDEAPFCWLRVEDNPALAFVVIDPFLVLPEYAPDIPKPDVEFLKLKTPADAMLLGIVTIHDAGRATMNLKGPLVINRHTLVGRQVIIANANAYAIAHPLPAADYAE
jgi:flagellar assembly factor FliW